MEEHDAEAAEMLHEHNLAADLLLPLTKEEALFVKRLARDGVAGRHVLCLFWNFLIGLGKLAFALSAIGAVFALASGLWHPHR